MEQTQCESRSQGLLGAQNGGLEKTRTNGRSRVSKIAEIWIVFRMEMACNWLIYGHIIYCLPGSSSSRHFERREV